MGEIEGTYRALPTSGTHLGGQTSVGVSTLEPEQTLSPRIQEKHLHIRVKLLDSTVEVFDIEVGSLIFKAYSLLCSKVK